MRKDTLINLRVNQDLKDAFQEVVEQEGLTMSEVLESCMEDVVKRGMVPLNIASRSRRKKAPILTIPLIKACLENLLPSESEKIKRVSLFGSYSKGTAKPSSDVDLFLEVDEGFTLFDLAALQEKLEKALGKKVDLATQDDDAYFYAHIQKEAIRLYERRE